jgi:putative membrane protein
VQRIVYLLVAFAHLLKHQLRETDANAILQRLLDEATVASIMQRNCRPQYVLQLLQEQFVAWHRAGKMSELMLHACLHGLDELTDALGGCERIINTPVPYAYDVLLHRTTYFYCALLPFGLVQSVGWMTPIIAVFISYAFLTVHTIASELEEPFGVDVNDLPLDALVVNLERALFEAIDTDIPPRPVPDACYRLK